MSDDERDQRCLNQGGYLVRSGTVMAKHEYIPLRQAVEKTLNMGGREVLNSPQRMTSYLLDMVDPASDESRVGVAAIDEEMLRALGHFADNLTRSNSNSVRDHVSDVLCQRFFIDAWHANIIATDMVGGVADWLHVSGPSEPSTATVKNTDKQTEKENVYEEPRPAMVTRRNMLIGMGLTAVTTALGGFAIGRLATGESGQETVISDETNSVLEPEPEPAPESLEDAQEEQQEPVSSAPVSSVFAAWRHSLGLLEDGTVRAAGHSGYGQCDVGHWTKVRQVTAGEYHTVALFEDGSVQAIGLGDDGQCDVGTERNVIAVAGGDYHTVLLHRDGTVSAVGYNHYGQCDVDNWSGVTAVDARWHHTVGLLGNGSVVATGINDNGQCDVGDWRNVASISAGWCHTVAVLQNGTAVAVGFNDDGRCNVSDWHNIKSVSAGDRHTVALLNNGTVVATGDNGYGQCDVGGWRDVVCVSAGWRHTVALLADGTVVATGDNSYGQCEVTDW